MTQHKLRYNRLRNEWIGTTEQGKLLHVTNHHYWRTYHELLRDRSPETIRERGRKLRGMTATPFWEPEARPDNADVFITNVGE
jgi:hypothetical protein